MPGQLEGRYLKEHVSDTGGTKELKSKCQRAEEAYSQKANNLLNTLTKDFNFQRFCPWPREHVAENGWKALLWCRPEQNNASKVISKWKEESNKHSGW